MCADLFTVIFVACQSRINWVSRKKNRNPGRWRRDAGKTSLLIAAPTQPVLFGCTPCGFRVHSNCAGSSTRAKSCHLLPVNLPGFPLVRTWVRCFWIVFISDLGNLQLAIFDSQSRHRMVLVSKF